MLLLLLVNVDAAFAAVREALGDTNANKVDDVLV